MPILAELAVPATVWDADTGMPQIEAALALVDLNRFKEINDTLGHVYGDELLRHVTTALRRECADGTAFRLGGDEFVIFFDTVTLTAVHGRAGLPDALRDVGERVLHAIQGPFPVAGVPITVEASIGVAHTGQPGMDGVHKLLADATAQVAAWHRAGWPVPVAVNLAAPVLTSDHIVDAIARRLAETGLPATSLIVEITESAVMTRPEESAERLRRLQELGVRIAMDDFGTGYTSLALLSRLPLDELKLDRTFIMRVHDQQEQVIVEAVARMAHGLGLTLVAEGVEDERTARTLAGFGIHQLQGFHFSRPRPAADFALLPA